MRRFVNADIVSGEITNAITLNRYAYANGNPVSFVDPFGLSANALKIIAGVAIISGLAVATALTGGTAGVIVGSALVGAAVGGTAGAVTGYAEDGVDGAVNGFLTGTIVGGVSGALSASPAGAVIQGVGNAAINVGESLLENLLANDFSDLSIQGLFVDATTGMILGYIGGDGLLRKNDKLAAAANLYDETMARELRRENKEYAQKKMADVMIYYTDTRAEALLSSALDSTKGESISFAAESGITHLVNNIARSK